ncbi:MAG TPA: DUF5668 domain-containing protein [Thermoanaerobaculaceae bacterium]|nr:DUF5668 domain-containing protein [Thermoanaerobaculaceae bacterium]
MSPERVYRNVPRLVFGLVIILLGVMFTLDKLDVISVGDYWAYWPVLLIAAGVARLVQPRGNHGRVSGVVIAGIGTLLLLTNLDLISDRVWHYWPVLLVLVGAGIVWRALDGGTGAGWPGPGGGRWGRRAERGVWTAPAVAPEAGAPPSDAGVAAAGSPGGGPVFSAAAPSPGAAPASEVASTVSAFALLGAVRRRSIGQDFRGGDLTAIMGGCELDLRGASIMSGDAVIDTFAMWGGIEIRVPEDWTVVVQGTPILGGFEDKTRHVAGDPRKVLVVRGAAVMGGVEIKN